MKRISVKLGDKDYDILIGHGLLEQAGKLLKDCGFNGKLVIISNPIVQELYGKALGERLSADSFQVTILSVTDGEEQKSLDVAGRLYAELSDCYVERTTPILALGGGVIGDLAGFVAATYMRGMPLVHIPTTFLAQVDSSIGGKVAINHGKLKNEIGAFYQPRLVISDTGTLKTLPTKELANGMAEVIKSAVIKNSEFFAFIENNLDKINMLDDTTLEEVVFRPASIKAKVVTEDELDTGLRNILNFGHTTGHAIETVSDFGVDHGHAVAIGMMVAAKIAEKLGFFDNTGLVRLKRILEAADLPTQMPRLDSSKIIQAMKHDKKIAAGKVRFVLPKAIGEVFISDEVDLSLVEEVLNV
jgi:3-dehydroquinate synthase